MRLKEDDLAFFVWHSRTIYKNLSKEEIREIFDLLLTAGCTFSDIGLDLTEKQMLLDAKKDGSEEVASIAYGIETSVLKEVFGNDYLRLLGFSPSH